MTGSGVDVVLIGGAVLAYALVSKRLAQTVFSAPMVFVGIGFVLGTEVFDVIEVEVGSTELRVLAEVTLALLLFTDASALDTMNPVCRGRPESSTSQRSRCCSASWRTA